MKRILPKDVCKGYSDDEIRFQTNIKRAKRMKRENAVFERAKALNHKSILTDDQFEIFCLFHGLNKMREKLNMSAIASVLDLHVEVVLEEYVKASELIQNNKSLDEINKIL